MKSIVKAIARRTPYLANVFDQRDQLREERNMLNMKVSHLQQHVQSYQTAEVNAKLTSTPDVSGIPMPPQPLAYRVIGNPNLPAFLYSGMRCVADLAMALDAAGKTPTQFQDIYDFGCGCGRLIRWFPALAPNARFYGSDTDAEAIAWCQENLTFAKFQVNPPLPTTGWPDGAFDLLYASSVFTHLDEERQFQWLAEVRRVLRKGGVALLTVHGPSTVEGLPQEMKDQYAKTGFLFRSSGDFWKGVFPDWYGNTHHSREYVATHFRDGFKLLNHIDKGLYNYQDIVTVEKVD